MALLLHAGADSQRVIDGHGYRINRFAAHLARLHALRGPGPGPLVVLTQTNPIALAILQARRVLEEAVPQLATAAWIIFHDESADPFFSVAAQGLGTFDVGFGDAPIWRAPHDYNFLVLSSQLTEVCVVAPRLAYLEREQVPVSGLRLAEPSLRAASVAPAVHSSPPGSGRAASGR